MACSGICADHQSLHASLCRSEGPTTCFGLGGRNSLNVQKVLWLIGKLGLDYKHIPAVRDFGKLNEPEFRRLNAKFTSLAIGQGNAKELKIQLRDLVV